MINAGSSDITPTALASASGTLTLGPLSVRLVKLTPQ